MSMASNRLIISPSYRAMVRGTQELHKLLADGKDDSPEADAIRYATDGPWQALSETERERLRKLSEDLYSLHEPSPPLKPMTCEVQAKLVEAYECRQRGEWERALELLREGQAYVDPALLSYLRGAIWLEAGDAETAALFLEHAFKLQPTNAKYHASYLHGLSLADPLIAKQSAEEILQKPDEFPPVVVSRAAHVAIYTARNTSGAVQVFPRLEPILRSTIGRYEQQGLDTADRFSYGMTWALVGATCEFAGNSQAAVEAYSRALQVEPNNDALLVARGILLYGTSPRAISDLESAVQLDSPLIWPYVLLAHHHLVNRRFAECLQFCQRAVNMDPSTGLESELLEWIGIAQAGLGFAAELVRGSFEKAIRLDPSNERAKRNLMIFEAANEPLGVQYWETRTASALRTSSLAERPLPLAA